MELDAAEQRVVSRARTRLHEVLDGLRPVLLERSGVASVKMKDDGTPVTDSDLEANERLIDALGTELPDHSFVSEETTTTYDGAEWAWIIDPIDGTSNFTTGIPYWCVSVALALRGQVVLGVVDAPPLDDRYEAVMGGGATRNGAPIRIRPPAAYDDPGNRHVPLLLTTMTARRVTPRVRLNPRVLGSAALDLCLVARGVAAAAVSLTPKLWDHAAGAVIVEEAGGVYHSYDADGLLPLVAGRDYAGRSATSAAGPDVAYLTGLAEHLVQVEDRSGR